MQTRKPFVAGQFYPGQYDSCVDEINECLEAETISEILPETIVAGIVPHAGWTFSGSLAALVFSAIKQQHDKVHTFVIFGAVHSYFGKLPAVYEAGSWVTPLGEVPIDEELAEAVLKTGTGRQRPRRSQVRTQYRGSGAIYTVSLCRCEDIAHSGSAEGAGGGIGHKCW